MSSRAEQHSLRRSLLRRLLVPLVLLFAVSGGGSYLLSLHFANDVYDAWLYDSVSSLALEVEATDQGVRLDLPEVAQRILEWDVADTTYFRISGSRSGQVAGRADLPATGANARPYRKAMLFNARVDGRDVRIASLVLPVAHSGEQVLVQVAETGRKRRALAREILLGTLLPQVLLILTAVGIVGYGIRTGLVPLNLIAERLNAQDPRRLQPVPEAMVPNEIRPLTQAINDLLARLDATLATQRRFVADTAHQLRTPLTALRLQLDEAAFEVTKPELLPDLRRTLGNLRITTDRAARLSNQLLALARAEPEAITEHAFEALDLRELAFETGADWVPRALQKDLELSFEAPAAVPIHGNPTLLREALNNLLDNAVQYHAGSGRIVLSVTAAPPAVTVADDGPGIPKAHRADVFRRFHRGDRSGGEGSGLGLAIVKEIMTAHGGDAALAEGLDGRGVRISLVFPKPR
ncbi:MAG: sensor histidine kinase N-terminal domain-containing protein [Nevskia sp.]